MIYVGRGPEPGVLFSRTELVHLLIGGGAVLAAWVLSDVGPAALRGYLTMDLVLVSLLIGGLGIGTGFLLHELSHKFVARHFGSWAEFRRSKTSWLVISIIVAISGFFFAMPGAVISAGHTDRRKNGIISGAGPATNLAVAAGLLPLYLLMGGPASIGFVPYVIGSVIFLNAFLGAFNMVPIEILPGLKFDGMKVLDWNKAIYAGLMAPLAALTVLFFFGIL